MNSLMKSTNNRISSLNVKLLLFSFISFILFNLSHAKPQLSKSFRPFSAESLIQYSSYHSVANYNFLSQYESLSGTRSFWNSTGFDASGRYVFSSDYALNLNLNYNQVEANVGERTKYNSSLQTIKFGLEKKLSSTFADFILEGVGQLSLFKVNESSTRPLVGDGAHGLGGNIWVLQRVWSTIYWHAKAGLLFRSDNLSSLSPYQFGLHGQIGTLTLSSIIDGYFSIISDSTNISKRTTYLNKSNVGSLQYRSYNPNSLSLDLQAQWQVTDQFGLNGGFGRTLYGVNSSHGSQFFVGVDFHWQTSPRFKNANPFKNTLPSKSSNIPDSDEDELKSYPISL